MRRIEAVAMFVVALAMSGLFPAGFCWAGVTGPDALRRGRRPKPKAPDAGVVDEVAKKGKISVVRGIDGGRPQLTDQTGKHWLLTGDLGSELVRLSGHVVHVVGTPGEKSLSLATLLVRRYEITDSGGHRPFVGILHEDDRHRLFLRVAEREIAVRPKKAFSRRLRRHLNCKVWIVGELEGDVLRPIKYGWLRCRKRPAIRTKKETGK